MLNIKKNEINQNESCRNDNVKVGMCGMFKKDKIINKYIRGGFELYFSLYW